MVRELDVRLLHPRHLLRALRLVHAAAPRWTRASLAVVVVQGLLPLASLYLLKRIVDAVEAGIATAGGGVPLGDVSGGFEPVFWLIALAAGVGLLGNGLQALSTWLTEAQAQHVTDHMQELVQTKSTEVELAFFENPAYRDTLHRAQREGASRPIQIVRGLVEIGRNGLSLAAIGALLVSYHWIIAPILAATAAPVLWLRSRHSRRMHAWQREATLTERKADYLGWIMLGEQNAREVRLFDLGPFFRERFRALRSRLRGDKLRLVAWRARADGLAQALGTVGSFGCFGFIAYRAFSGAITLGDLVVFYSAFQRAQGFLQGAMQTASTVYENNLYLQNFFEFLDLEPRVSAPPQPEPVPVPLRDGVEVDGVSFTYPGTKRAVLEDVSLAVRPGEVVAIVGENGSGKTTLIKLLCRFYDPSAGSIRLDGVDLRRFRPEALRRQISVIFQDYVWYHLLSARENIWLGATDAPPDEKRLQEAALQSGADEFVSSLPQGYDNPMGRLFEGGEDLSIGQWQRLALARAFYREAQLLILDEPSSALDPKAEAEIFERLRRLTAHQATILISHRLSNVRLADRIYVLEEGRVVESGTHDELMASDGAYRLLFDLQARSYR